MKILTIISIAISSLGLWGGLILMTEGDDDGLLAFAIFGFYLAYAIVVLRNQDK